MSAIPFVVGDASRIASAIVAGGLAAYGCAAILVARRGFRRHLADRWSTLVCGFALLACAAAMFRWGPGIVPAPFGTFAVVALAFGATFAILFVVLRLQEFVDRSRAAVERVLKIPAPELEHEERRKLPHLAMGINAATLLGLGHAVLAILTFPAPSGPHGPETWGNLVAARDAAWHLGGMAVLLASLLLLVLLLAPVELLRLAFPELAYPWKRIIVPLLRPREEGLLGGHLHMAVGVTTATLVLARDASAWSLAAHATMAVILVAVFADAASALVGKRFGRRKWRHNTNKSYAGTLGGTVAAVALATPFVGIPLAVATAAWFLLVDVAAPVPVPVSDNLLNPIGLAILYVAGWAWIAPMIMLP